MDMSLSKLQEMVKDWRAAVLGVTESDMTDWLNNIIEENVKKNIYIEATREAIAARSLMHQNKEPPQLTPTRESTCKATQTQHRQK